MMLLIFTILLATGFAYVGLQNTIGVPLKVGDYFFESVPLYLVCLGSLLVGLIIGYIFSLIKSVASSFTLHGKDKKIEKLKEEILSMRKKMHQLELENAHFTSEDADPVEDKSL